ncbi:GNAT family N-acetyltransferase [Deefgea rivuli]|uniref:GNAT family N-acetyltransferase n=1 Tax=Deefgea rivuli TaxID=400948 RepID=UPI00068737A5|nr:GNAT family N-acetyltransferase [Deefgea rivuli]
MHAPLHTLRLVLRPLTEDDAGMVVQLAGEWQVASKTGRIPYPYELEMALDFIRAQHSEREVIFAVCRQADGALMGCVGASFDADSAELGYWFGLAYWGQGFATEAAQVFVPYILSLPTMTQMTSSHLLSNLASGRVLAKLGFIESERETVNWRNEGQVELVKYLYRPA